MASSELNAATGCSNDQELEEKFIYLDPSKDDLNNNDHFIESYINLANLVNINLWNMRRLCCEKLLIELQSLNVCEDWIVVLQIFNVKICDDVTTFMKGSYLKTSLSLGQLRLNTEEQDELKKQLSKKCQNELYSIVNNERRRMNRFIWFCAATVCVIFNENVKNCNIQLDVEHKDEINQLFRSNSHFMDLLSLTDPVNIELMKKMYERAKNNDLTRNRFGRINRSIIRSTRNNESIYKNTSSSSKRSVKRKSIKDLQYTDDISMLTPDVVQGKHKESCEESFFSKKAKHNITRSIFETSLTETINVEDGGTSLQVVEKALSRMDISTWFQSLQGIKVSDGDIILNLQWIEYKGHHIPQSTIEKFDIVRKEFLDLIKSPYDLSSQCARVKEFISSKAYFNVQVKFNTNSYDWTKADGLCFLRSLMQLKRRSSPDFKLPDFDYDESEVWEKLDVKLEIDESREEFLTFLDLLIKALSSMTENNTGISEKKIDELKQNWVPKIEYARDRILNFGSCNWNDFKLDKTYWCSWFVIKCIPHVFSQEFLIFPGAYFMSNNEDNGKHYRQLNWETYAFLACAMKFPCFDVYYPYPLSLKLPDITSILIGHQFVFHNAHCFPINTAIPARYYNAISYCVDQLSDQIIKFISSYAIPELPLQVELDIVDGSQEGILNKLSVVDHLI